MNNVIFVTVFLIVLIFISVIIMLLPYKQHVDNNYERAKAYCSSLNLDLINARDAPYFCAKKAEY